MISTYCPQFQVSHNMGSLLIMIFCMVSFVQLSIFCTRVQKDVISSLCLRNPVTLRASFNRPNIFYEGIILNLLSFLKTEAFIFVGIPAFLCPFTFKTSSFCPLLETVIFVAFQFLCSILQLIWYLVTRTYGSCYWFTANPTSSLFYVLRGEGFNCEP